MQLIRDWFRLYFSNPQVVILVLILFLGFALVIFFGDMLAPVLASGIIAYLLEPFVQSLQARRLPRLVAVLIVFLAFMAFVLFIVFALMPMLSQQATQLFREVPESGVHGTPTASPRERLQHAFGVAAKLHDSLGLFASYRKTLECPAPQGSR